MWTSPTLTPVFILVILAVKQIEGRDKGTDIYNNMNFYNMIYSI